MTAARTRHPVMLLLLLAAAAPATVQGCDCGKGAPQPAENSLQRPGSARWGGGGGGAAATTSTLDDILTPQLVQSYLALQLHRAALDLTRDTADARLGAGCPPQAPCRDPSSPPPLRRSRRFATKGVGSDVPVVSGLAGLPSAEPLVALHKSVESNDVPVFKGNHEGTPLIRVVTPPPAAVAAARSAGATTAPTVPVVKGSADPAHPGPATPKVSSLLPGDLQLTPEEEEALAVLLEGRHGHSGKKPTASPIPLRPRPTPRPALRPTRPPAVPAVTSVSGKVGGKAQQPAGVQRHYPSGNSPAGGGGEGGNGGNCCTQKRLLQELEKQLSILRQLNADHLREEWVRASYPSPYYPYLHNLPVHPARGYDAVPGSPALLPTYFLPSSAGSRRRSADPALPPWRAPPGPEAPLQSDCEWPARAEGGSRLDDKTHFSEQQREADDLRGDDPQDDVGVDPKIGEPVDFEVR